MIGMSDAVDKTMQLHLHVYWLQQRQMFLDHDLQPREVVEAFDGEGHVVLFRTVARQCLGREVAMNEATRSQLRKIRRVLAEKIATLERSFGRRDPAWFPDEWATAMQAGLADKGAL